MPYDINLQFVKSNALNQQIFHKVIYLLCIHKIQCSMETIHALGIYLYITSHDTEYVRYHKK